MPVFPDFSANPSVNLVAMFIFCLREGRKGAIFGPFFLTFCCYCSLFTWPMIDRGALVSLCLTSVVPSPPPRER